MKLQISIDAAYGPPNELRDELLRTAAMVASSGRGRLGINSRVKLAKVLGAAGENQPV